MPLDFWNAVTLTKERRPSLPTLLGIRLTKPPASGELRDCILQSANGQCTLLMWLVWRHIGANRFLRHATQTLEISLIPQIIGGGDVCG